MWKSQLHHTVSRWRQRTRILTRLIQNCIQAYCQSSVLCVLCSRLLCPYWFVSCPCSVSLLIILVQLCLSNYLCVSCVFIVLSVQLVLSGPTRYSVPVCLLCLVLPCLDLLKTVIWVYPHLVFLAHPAISSGGQSEASQNTEAVEANVWRLRLASTRRHLVVILSIALKQRRQRKRLKFYEKI